MTENSNLITQVKKRDGTIAAFDIARVTRAIEAAMNASQQGSPAEAEKVAKHVCDELEIIRQSHKSFIPNVEKEFIELESYLEYMKAKCDDERAEVRL